LYSFLYGAPVYSSIVAIIDRDYAISFRGIACDKYGSMDYSVL